jgi:nucleoside-diphosphate-sugar epimerase
MTNTENTPRRSALVVGGTGISGSALTRELVAQGWRTTSLSRRQVVSQPGVETVRADLSDTQAVQEALSGLDPTHVFFTAWSRRPTEAENITVNAAMVRNVLDTTGPSGNLQHVALVTGLKHYLGPFEAYGTEATRDTPFHEDEPRLETPNFYYAQEDELWQAAAEYGFDWSVHRSHTMIGHALGNAMNLGQTLAAQAALCRAEGSSFVFPGNETQWNGVTDMTDSSLLARQMIWAATTPGLPSQAYNTANGDVFRWRWMWPRIAQLLGVEPEGYADRPRPLEDQMAGKDDLWRELVESEDLAEPNLARVASWWHTDGDLNRPVECFTDMTRSRSAGFTGYADTLASFATLFETLRRERVIPA